MIIVKTADQEHVNTTIDLMEEADGSSPQI